jgi:hypothetical protein
MNARTEELNNQINLLQEAVKDGNKGLLEAFEDFKGLQNEMWWAEQGEKLDNAKQSVLNGLQSAKDWTTEKYNTASQAISDWFEEMKNKMSVAWGEFKEYAGQKFENFKEAMQQFGEEIAEMWGKAMESLGKLFDEIKIGAHDMFVDVKTGMQNLCTDMSCGVANLGIAMQKGVLAMDDAFQSVKGSVSQAVADKFNKSAGQLLVESELAYQDMLNTQSRFSKMDFTGQDDKTIISAQKYQETVLDKMSQDHEKLTEKIQSRESFRDTFQGMKKQADFKKDVFNVNRKASLNKEAHLNTRSKNAVKEERSDKAKAQKSSYADKVRESRSTSSTGRVM